jgi:hypothetical protein
MTKIIGSGSISQRHGFADPDPDPHQNVMDPQHCLYLFPAAKFHKTGYLSFLLYIFVGFLPFSIQYSLYCIGVTLSLHLKCTVFVTVVQGGALLGLGCPTDNRTGNLPCSSQACYPIINVSPLIFHCCSVITVYNCFSFRANNVGGVDFSLPVPTLRFGFVQSDTEVYRLCRWRGT